MLIDWFTVGAQVVNFLILVWLLKRFLYKPILDAIDAREKRIASELADAAAKQAEAQKERDEFQYKNEAFEQQRATLMTQAKNEAKTERMRLLDEARQAAESLSAKRQETLRNDAHHLNQALSRRVQQEVFAIARKALTDLAGTSLEERMGDVFVRRLREMDNQTKTGLAVALKSASDPACVRSAFDLSAAQRTAIQNALNETFSADIQVRFETEPDLISGIELTSNGQKVAWSIAEYLASLEKGVDELLKEKDTAQAKKPSDLTRQIGKRAYALYEEHGSKEGLAAQDWEEAEREIRNETPKPVKTEPEPEGQAKSEVKPEANAELEPEAHPENKVAPKPAVQAGPESEANGEPKPDAKAEPEANPETKNP